MPSTSTYAPHNLLDDVNSEAQLIRGKVRTAWNGFMDFALRDNVLEVAVGLIIAGASSDVVKSLVADIFLPVLSLFKSSGPAMPVEQFWLLRPGSNYNESAPYVTRKQAIDDGAIIMPYGVFVDKVFSFFGVVVCMYTIANLYRHFARASKEEKEKVKCEYCLQVVSDEKCMRCPSCTSWRDGREPKTSPIVAPLIQVY